MKNLTVAFISILNQVGKGVCNNKNTYFFQFKTLIFSAIPLSLSAIKIEIIIEDLTID